MNHLDRTVWPQPGGNPDGGTPPGGIAIQHEDHTLEALEKSTLLGVIQCRSHQGDHRTNPGLVEMEAVKETFDHHDHTFASRCGTVEIEQDLRFGEARGKTVARLG